jgi:hypothetical protein
MHSYDIGTEPGVVPEVLTLPEPLLAPPQVPGPKGTGNGAEQEQRREQDAQEQDA